MDYAYARVSSRDQNLERQIEEFLKFGIHPNNIYCDKKSGKNFDRSAYSELTSILKQGDLLVVKSIDRLGRNYDAIISEWSRITGELNADILVLDMPLLDTRTKANTLVGKFISDIVLQVLSFVAENERQNIRARQAEGIALAKAHGVRFGRHATVYTPEFKEIAAAFRKKQISLETALDQAGMKSSNFYYHLSRYEKEASQGSQV